MAAVLVLIGLGFLWLVIKGIEGISDASANLAARNQNKETFKNQRGEKYSNRVIDSAKSLFSRNLDIIEKFAKKVEAHPSESHSYGRRYRSYSSPGNYHIENLTRDCINEIALAEDNFGVSPGSAYLSNWKPTASKDWATLATEVEAHLRAAQEELRTAEKKADELEQKRQRERQAKETKEKELAREISRIDSALKARIAKRNNPLSARDVRKRGSSGVIRIEDLEEILTPNIFKWTYEVNEGSKAEEEVVKFPTLDKNIDNKAYVDLKNRIDAFNATLDADAKLKKENKEYFSKILESKKKGEVIQLIDYVLDDMELPSSIPKTWSVDFEPEEGIAIVEISLPDVVHNQIYKNVQLKTGTTRKLLNQKEIKESVPKIHPAIILRTAYEIFRNDDAGVIKLLVVNGWVEFDDPSTGNKARTYTASLAVTKKQIVDLNLEKIDPIFAFSNLKGKSAGKLIDIIPVTPVMSLDRKDKRFIETKEVLGKLGAETNLASMEWQDFENLIAELFQREFSEEGTEIKLTQSSRDKGVDAVVFNPDPIRGGKYVIQAKRYTNTVDVSAVRDLVAVVAHEGASRGILVTTSTFGADAYAFVQNKPITLLDGAKLLGLLEKHGYKFSINLAEARKLINLAPKKQRVS